MKIMRTLYDHPNVIKLYETFEGENTYYLVMEIVEGTFKYILYCYLIHLYISYRSIFI